MVNTPGWRLGPVRLQCIVFTSIILLSVNSYTDIVRLVILVLLGSPSSILLQVLGKAVGREKESFAVGTITENWWVFLPCMAVTRSATMSSIAAAMLHTMLSVKVDPMVSGLTVLVISKMARNVDSVILACGLTSTALIYAITRYHRRLAFREAVYRFTSMFVGSTVLGCAVLRVDWVSPYLSKSAISIYGYWVISLLWMFYLSSLIPIKFQPSRFRLYLSRKLYHFAAFSMFAPTLIVDRRVTVSAMAAALMLFVGVEVCRLQSDRMSDKEALWFTKHLSSHLTIEEGALRTDFHPITSHISLLAGCFLPAYFASCDGVGEGGWAEMSGILSVGIGDAMACLFGIMFGRLRVNARSSKTVEGMLAGWAATCLVRLMLRPLPWHPWLVLVDGITAGVEAVNQADGCNDNLLMPLVSFALVRNMSPFL